MWSRNRLLVSTFSIRRSAWGSFWLIRPSISLIQLFPCSPCVNGSGLKNLPLDIIQKGCSLPSGRWAAGFGWPFWPGVPDIRPLIHGRNSFDTCEWPILRATYTSKNEVHQGKTYRCKFIANSWVPIGVVRCRSTAYLQVVFLHQFWTNHCRQIFTVSNILKLKEKLW